MRPEILFPAFAATTTLKGCGPRVGKLLEKLGLNTVADLWWHLPSGLIDRRFRPKVTNAPDGVICSIAVTVERHFPPRAPRLPWRVKCVDDSGELWLVYFNGRDDYLRGLLPEGQRRLVSGKVEHFNDQIQITHPDLVVSEDEAAQLNLLEPLYPLTAGITPKVMRKLVDGAMARLPDLPEWQDAAWLSARGWAGWKHCLQTAHEPTDTTSLDPTDPVRARLAYDELLANQLALVLVRAKMKRTTGLSLVGDGELRRKVIAALPWALSAAQEAALAEIAADLASPQRMQRLLQGDVGSGKTVVALLAMLVAVEARAQAALVAPTEILARQHLETLTRLTSGSGVTVALLTGRDKGKGRDEILARLAAGEIDLIVGTHALFQNDVQFHSLALAVIDEQHRFGVHQRLTLAAKGQRDSGGIDLLVMTATPIPRTLALTAYGDMDVSLLRDKPPGRQPVETRTIAIDRLDEVVDGICRRVDAGGQVYWVCPLVEESEHIDIAAAEERFMTLQSRLGKQSVGLVHGRMKATEKDAAMSDFAAGRTKVLVATTVIEVGVDVPQATVMVIEHAERFGLAQLHQLRGRVGRGGLPGSCLLLFASPLGEIAKSRLKIMRETEDGFTIAEEDLRLRGAGDILGTRQSGLPEFRMVDLAAHGELLAAARDDAQLIVSRDADLLSPRGQALRILLYLFARDAAIRNLRSG